MNHVAGVALVLVILCAGWVPARAGHGVVYYPSFYPQEIRVETMDPAPAAALFRNNTLHAYIGSAPRFTGSVPDHLKSVDSLDSLLVLALNRTSEAFGRRESRCAAADGILAALAGNSQGVIFNPYPVTPYHPDYLHHLDRIEDAKAAVRAQGPIERVLKFRARGPLAEALVPSRWRLDRDDWDVSLEAVPVDRLTSTSSVRLNGWPRPPWMKEGWFHAYRLLAPAIAGPEEKERVDATYEQLVRGEYLDLTERLNLERSLLADLTRGCDRLVVGYTLRREYYSDDFSEGVENITFDSQSGLNSDIFIRTVKLKDFPWNGWLRIGIDEEPAAAWNPVAGFTDSPGRLAWSILADPALIPLPHNGSWIPSRIDPDIAVAKGQSGGFAVPADAVIPAPGTGALEPVGKGKFSSAKVVYRVLASRFHDGADMEVADLLYPYVLAYRWAVKAGEDDSTYDPAIEAATALIRGRLVGVRVARVERTINEMAPDIKVPLQTPVVEVYVNYASPDSLQVAALAPPWSAVPWHLLALMEEAVKRGFAAFSEEEAERREVGWLDLARDPALQQKLIELVEAFEREGYRPAALEGLVSAETARSRWRALGKFVDRDGHFLVTNGPYRLKEWSKESFVFEVIRELTYPLGIGTFNRYAYPSRAVITEVKRESDRIVVEADVEKVVKAQRSRKIVRERLTRTTTRGPYPVLVESRYLVLDADGSVVTAGRARWEDDGRFTVDLPDPLPLGRYTFLVAIYLDDNFVDPAARMLRFRADGS